MSRSKKRQKKKIIAQKSIVGQGKIQEPIIPEELIITAPEPQAIQQIQIEPEVLYWMNTENVMNTLDQREYQYLDPTWKKQYSYDDTSKNGFTIDYLFNELLKNDIDNLVINEDMFPSFCKLAKISSI